MMAKTKSLVKGHHAIGAVQDDFIAAHAPCLFHRVPDQGRADTLALIIPVNRNVFDVAGAACSVLAVHALVAAAADPR